MCLVHQYYHNYNDQQDECDSCDSSNDRLCLRRHRRFRWFAGLVDRGARGAGAGAKIGGDFEALEAVPPIGVRLDCHQ